MGQHSGQEIYINIQNLGVFNPRLNVVYLLDIKSVSEEIIAEVERQSATFFSFRNHQHSIERMRYDKSIYVIEYCGFLSLHLEKSYFL